MPNLSYVRLPDGKATVTCTCGWSDPLGPMPPSPFDPAEALAAASAEHLLCNPSPTTVAVMDELLLARLRTENEQLKTRQQELLQTIARLGQTVPFPEEWQGWEGTRAKMIAEIGTLRDAVRVAEAVRDDAQAQNNRYIEDKRRAFADGVLASIRIVEQRKTHYELYRCDCLDRDPGNGHVPGCKGEMMSTHPATFAILDEIYTFLRGLLGRSDLHSNIAPLQLSLSEATVVACAVAHHRDRGLGVAEAQQVLTKIEEACK